MSTTAEAIAKELARRIPANLSLLRKHKKLTQKALSQALQIKACTIGAYEEGRATPPVATFLQICRFFDVSIDDFLNKTVRPVPPSNLPPCLHKSPQNPSCANTTRS